MAGNVSLLQFVEGGGILSDAIVVLHDLQFVMSNTVSYGKSMSKTAPLARICMTETGEDGAELDHEQFLSLGGASDFVPSDDGLGLTKVGTKDAIVKTTNYAVFVQSIMDAGFPPDRAKDNDISFLEGLKCHVTRKVVQREGMEKREGREATALIVDKLYLDEKPVKRKSRVGTKAAAGTTTSPGGMIEPDAALIEEAKSILLQVLFSDDAQAGKYSTDGSATVTKSKIIPPVLSLVKNNPAKRELTKIIVGDEFLNLCDGWTYEKGVVAVG